MVIPLVHRQAIVFLLIFSPGVYGAPSGSFLIFFSFYAALCDIIRGTFYRSKYFYILMIILFFIMSTFYILDEKKIYDMLCVLCLFYMLFSKYYGEFFSKLFDDLINRNSISIKGSMFMSLMLFGPSILQFFGLRIEILEAGLAESHANYLSWGARFPGIFQSHGALISMTAASFFGYIIWVIGLGNGNNKFFYISATFLAYVFFVNLLGATGLVGLGMLLFILAFKIFFIIFGFAIFLIFYFEEYIFIYVENMPFYYFFGFLTDPFTFFNYGTLNFFKETYFGSDATIYVFFDKINLWGGGEYYEFTDVGYINIIHKYGLINTFIFLICCFLISVSPISNWSKRVTVAMCILIFLFLFKEVYFWSSPGLIRLLFIVYAVDRASRRLPYGGRM